MLQVLSFSLEPGFLHLTSPLHLQSEMQNRIAGKRGPPSLYPSCRNHWIRPCPIVELVRHASLPPGFSLPLRGFFFACPSMEFSSSPASYSSSKRVNPFCFCCAHFREALSTSCSSRSSSALSSLCLFFHRAEPLTSAGRYATIIPSIFPGCVRKWRRVFLPMFGWPEKSHPFENSALSSCVSGFVTTRSSALFALSFCAPLHAASPSSGFVALTFSLPLPMSMPLTLTLLLTSPSPLALALALPLPWCLPLSAATRLDC
mmetsp:Transcript_26228/g.69887  ORF Transcript_26228/g.69887 Transcript_26228/m.69887 type:complete len:260 (-) Transcript_26228:9-788(-)